MKTTKSAGHMIINVCLSIIFHYCRNHKEELTALRAWFVVRYIVDLGGNGWARIEEVSKIVKVKPTNLRRSCKYASLIIGVSPERLYYQSLVSL